MYMQTYYVQLTSKQSIQKGITVMSLCMYYVSLRVDKTIFEKKMKELLYPQSEVASNWKVCILFCLFSTNPIQTGFKTNQLRLFQLFFPSTQLWQSLNYFAFKVWLSYSLSRFTSGRDGLTDCGLKCIKLHFKFVSKKSQTKRTRLKPLLMNGTMLSCSIINLHFLY